MILIIGNYTNKKVILQRLLPAPNPAASSRILRMAMAIKSVGHHAEVLSSANAAKIGFNKKGIDPSFCIEEDGVKIRFSSALLIPILSAFWELISLPVLFVKMTRRYSVKAVILYCYYPSIFIVGLIARYKNIRIIEDLQDITTTANISSSNPSFLDYLRQRMGGFLMKGVLRLSDVVIIPTVKFKKYIPLNKKTILIAGCMQLDHREMKEPAGKGEINILFSGLLNKEQGLELLFDTLKRLDSVSSNGNKFKFTICGYGNSGDYISERILEFKNLKIDFLGFIDYITYLEILAKSNVCLVLQDPGGVFGLLKTPSKGFEYMAHGKMVIVSNVGDFPELPMDAIVLLRNYNSHDLAEILSNLTFNTIKIYGANAYKYANENWSFPVVGERIVESLKHKF